MSSGTSTALRGDIRQEWWVVDATNQVLGRLATRVARVLSGKHRAHYVPYLDTGDFVVVTNAEKVLLTGRKLDDEDLPPAHRLSRRLEVGPREGSAGEVPRAADRGGGARHAPQVEARPQAAEEAQGLSRGVAPPRGAEAAAADAPVRRAAG